MIISHWLIGVAWAAMQVAVPAEPPPSAATAVTPEAFNLGAKPAKTLTQTEAETIRSQCGDRKFETSAEGMIGGKMRRRRVTLCAAPGDSDAQWLAKLENAVAWVKAQNDLSDPVKDQLVAELRNEIARPKSVKLAPAPPVARLPAADALVATVPPMPAPFVAPPYSAATAMASPLMARPPLTIRCLGSGERGAGSRCDRLAPGMVFTVHADANLSGPAALRFMRKGQQRAEVDVAALRQGQIMRLKLPPEVCAGVVRSEVAIQIVAGKSTPGRVAQVTDTMGPYPIHC